MQGHPKCGQPTYFVEKVINAFSEGLLWTEKTIDSLHPEILEHAYYLDLNFDEFKTKSHTIRLGWHFKPIDKLCLAIWDDKPYKSKPIRVWEGEIRAVDIVLLYFGDRNPLFQTAANFEKLNPVYLDPAILAKNDGLELDEFIDWFRLKGKRPKDGIVLAQILIWDKEISY